MLLLNPELKSVLQKHVKKLPRYDLHWEWMEQSAKGEYVRVEDVVLMLANFNRAQNKNVLAKPQDIV